MIGDEGAPLAHVIGPRRQHEVIDSELAAALEQVCKRTAAARSFQQVGLLDFDPGQPTTFGAELIELVGDGFLLKEERPAGNKALFARRDLWRGQTVGCHDCYPSIAKPERCRMCSVPEDC